MKKILVTGASGFIGQALCSELIKLNLMVCGTVRNSDSLSVSNDFECISVGDINSETNWKNALEKVDCIIHCAGRAHVMNGKKVLDSYRLINTEGSKRLAEQATEAGVKRLVFLSSVKVNGESTGDPNSNKVFTNYDIPNPQDYYAISKFEAEEALREIASRTGLEVVVVRLPLVYGHGVKGNLNSLMKLINYSMPLPFSLINNQRSLIGIDNLVNFLIHCIEHPYAPGKTFLVSDGEDLSTPDLIKLITSSMGRRARLFPFPPPFLKLLGTILGKKKEINRLIGSLKIDKSFMQEEINWSPPISVKEGIRRMVKGK